MVSAASAVIHLSPGERVSHHHAQQRCAVLECHLPADSVTRKVLGSVWRRTKLGGSWGGDFIVCFFSGLIVASCFVWKCLQDRLDDSFVYVFNPFSAR